MAKRNDSMMLTSPGQTDLGALRFHGLEAVRAGGRAVAAGYRRARPHVVAAAEATGRAVEAVARRGAAAVRTWRAKPNDARFADAPTGCGFAAICPGAEGGFSVVGYHPTHGGAVSAIQRSGADGHIVVLRTAKANARPPAGTPTSTNLFALWDVFKGQTIISNRVSAVDMPHLRRCLNAGLLTATKTTLALTPAGAAAVAAVEAEHAARDAQRSETRRERAPSLPSSPVQPSLFDAVRRPASGDDRAMGSAMRREAARERVVASFPPGDVTALHDIFWNQTLVRTRGEPPYYLSIASKAVAAGLALGDGAGNFALTADGRAVVAVEHARLDAQMRREEGHLGAAMRREAAAEDRRDRGRSKPNGRPVPRAATPPTDLNLWVLSELFRNTSTISARVEASHTKHLRRCLKAGLLTAAGGRLTLTEAGIAALSRWRASQPHDAKHNGRDRTKDPLWGIFPRDGGGYLCTFAASTQADAMEQWVEQEKGDRRVDRAYLLRNYVAHPISR